MDTFLLEGYKIIYRYCAAFLILRRGPILECQSIHAVTSVFENDPFLMERGDDDRLSKAAFDLSLSRSDIERDAARRRQNKPSTDCPVSPEPNRFLPKLSEPSLIISDDHWSLLCEWTPPR